MKLRQCPWVVGEEPTTRAVLVLGNRPTLVTLGWIDHLKWCCELNITKYYQYIHVEKISIRQLCARVCVCVWGGGIVLQ